MGFLNPALFGLLGLGSIPVIIHILNRRRYQTVPWPAMAFLLAAQVKTRQRLRLENLLLLIVRTLAVLLFALAATRPFLPSAAGVADLGPDRRHLYILVDNSASMGYQEGISTLLQRGVREAKAAVEKSLRSDDPVTLVVACDETRGRGRPHALLRGTRNHAKVAETLERITLSDARMDPAAALAEVAAVAEPGDSNRTLLVLSDFPQADWAPAAPPDPEPGSRAPGDAAAAPSSGAAAIRAQLDRLERAGFDLRGAFRFLASPDPEDVCVLSLGTTDGRPPAEGQATAFEVVVGNNGPAAVEAEVRLTVDDREIGSQRVSLRGRPNRSAAPESSRVSFPWSGVAGSHYAAAQVTAAGNRLAANDRRGHAFLVRERFRVLLVDGDPSPADPARLPETRILEMALELPRGPTPCEVKVIPADDFPREDFEDEDVVVLANVDRVPETTFDRVGLFVRRGGGLLVFLGDRTDSPHWNAALRRAGIEDLLPARLGASPRFDPANPVSLDLSPSRHPALRDLTDPRHGTSFDPPLVSGWWPVEPAAEGVEVLLRLRDLARSPYLLERHHGRGRTLLCTGSADWDWTSGSLLFAPLVQEVVGYLATAGLERRDLLVHETLAAEVPAAGRNFTVTDPHSDTQAGIEPVDRAEGPERDARAPRTLSLPDTSRAGRYTLRWREPSDGRGAAGAMIAVSRDYAVNLDPREADLARLRPGDLEERLQMKGLGFGGEGEAEAREKEREAGRGDLTGFVLALAALLVIAEMFLAAFFGRKRR